MCVYPTMLFAMNGTLGTWYEIVPHAHDRDDACGSTCCSNADVAADPEVIAALPLSSRA